MATIDVSPIQGFDENYYLAAKAAQLTATTGQSWNVAQTLAAIQAAGLTAEQHYSIYGCNEGLAPNAYYNDSYYATSKAAQAGITVDQLRLAWYNASGSTNLYTHYMEYGAYETGVNPSSGFDDASYYAAKAAQMGGTTTPDQARAAIQAAGMNAISHYLLYGINESLTYTPVASPVVGQTYTLTTGADIITAGSGNDTFVGLVDATTPANATLSAVDNLNGGSGTDTLSITTQAADAIADAVNGAIVTGVEVVKLRATGAGGVGLNANNVVGMTSLNNFLSTDAVTITNLGASADLVITGNGAATNGATTATFVAGKTAGGVTFDGGTTAGAVAVNGTGFTSFAVNSTGATNVIGTLSTTGTPAATKIAATTAFETTGLTVGTLAAGNQTLTVSGVAAGRDATATSAAKSAVTLGAFDADFVSVDASGLTAGGVSGTLSATTSATFTGGAGSDRITTSTSGQTGVVDAGLGTDTLTVANSVDLDTKAEGAIYRNFETLGVVNGVAVDMDNVTGSTITAINVVAGAGATGVTNMNATQGAAVTLGAGAASSLTLGIKNATVVGTDDVLNINVTDGNTTTGEACVTAAAPTIAGVETINLTATDNFTAASLAGVTGMTKMTATGPGTVSVTTGAHAATSNESVDFSNLTAASTFNFSGATGNAMAFKGGSAIDTVTDSAIGGNVITTYAGADSITLTAKTDGVSGDIITGGAGADSTNVAAAKGNSANQVITFKYASTDSVCDSSVTGTGYVASKMDTVAGIDLATVAAAGTGHQLTFDTDVSGTAVTFSNTAVTFGTTSVTNAGDFYVYNTGAGGITYAYQDSNGNKTIDSGDWAVRLTGAVATATTSGEFTVVSGNLVLTTIAG